MLVLGEGYSHEYYLKKHTFNRSDDPTSRLKRGFRDDDQVASHERFFRAFSAPGAKRALTVQLPPFNSYRTPQYYLPVCEPLCFMGDI